MDISGVAIPALPEVEQQPPRNAEVLTAVSEVSQTETEQNDSGSNTSGSNSEQRNRDNDSNLGRVVDERV